MIKELEEKIIELENELEDLGSYVLELENYNYDELIRDNNQLRNELDSLDSYILELETNYEDEITSLEIELEKRNKEISSLEYDLFIEKTRDSKNKFYWFTAKKTPLVSDVSYMCNENDFYGFKQVPKYKIIEKHDLRFITNCSLDDLFEQYR